MKTESPRSFSNFPRSLRERRFAWWFGCLLVAVWLAGLAGHASAQSYGPPAISSGGTLYTYEATFDQGDGLGVCDFYADPTYSYIIQIDQWGYTYSTTNGAGGYVAFYQQSNGFFNNPAYVGVTSDGQGFSANVTGLVVKTNSPIGPVNLNNGWVSPDLAFNDNNGNYYSLFLNPQPNQLFNIGASPWYLYNGGNVVIDERSGTWPPSNVFNAPPPQTIYLVDQDEQPAETFALNTTSQDGGTAWYEETDYYTNATGQSITIGRNYYNGNYSGNASGNSDIGTYFSTTFDPLAQTFGSMPDNLQISLSNIVGDPNRQGPLYFSWDGNLMMFNQRWDFTDWYMDSTRMFFALIRQGSATSAENLGTQYVISGTYDLNTSTFSIADPNFFALDDNGNPIGLPAGVTLLFGSSGPGHTLLDVHGATYQPPFSYRRPDGAWGLKYTNLPDGLYLVQDEAGNYTAPPYKFQAASGDTVVNAISGWPATNLYPQQLYINGIPCTLVAGSQYDSGAGFPRNGGASYRASNYDLTVILSWNWDVSTGFQGFVTGKYGQSSAFKGSWDGLANFSNLTNGAIASVTAPTGTPTDGKPPQISVNGTALQYNSLASAALANAGTPGDVYTGSLGQVLTIYQNGTTSFTPGTGGTAITGTYNATTHQFSFGTGGNSVTVTNSDGSTSDAVITATDTGGHNLATPIGGATNGNGVTELAGGLDIRGNNFTLGSWTTGNESVFGLGIAYGDAVSGSGSTAQLNLSTTRAAVNWNWIHPSVDGGSDQVTAMQLDAMHRVLLYDPTQTGSVGLVLDPSGANGNTGVSGTIRVWQRGDIPMGQYVHGTQPPVPNGPAN